MIGEWNDERCHDAKEERSKPNYSNDPPGRPLPSRRRRNAHILGLGDGGRVRAAELVLDLLTTDALNEQRTIDAKYNHDFLKHKDNEVLPAKQSSNRKIA